MNEPSLLAAVLANPDDESLVSSPRLPELRSIALWGPMVRQNAERAPPGLDGRGHAAGSRAAVSPE
jgi:hypothetical protein